VTGDWREAWAQAWGVLSIGGLARLVLGGTVFSAAIALVPVMSAGMARGVVVLVTMGFWAWLLVHWCLGYGEALPATMRADLRSAVLLTAAATVVGVLWAPPALVLALVAAMMFVVVLVRTGLTTDDAAAYPELSSGTAWVLGLSLAKQFRRALRRQRIFGKPLLKLLRFMAPTRDVSCFATTMLIVLATVAGAAFANVPIVHDTLSIPGSAWTTEAGADDVSATESTDQSYDEICVGLPPPGEGVPVPAAEYLRALWLGGKDVDGNKVDGVGAGVGGCTHGAVAAAPRAGTWAVEGYCGSELRSLAIVMPDGRAVMMLGQVAAFARTQLRAGKLIGALPRVGVEDGDMQVVLTVDGSYVLVRDRQSEGRLPPGTKSRPCAQSTDLDSHYTIVTPGAVRPWAAAVASGWRWPRLTSATSTGGTFEFHDGGGNVDGRAQCTSPMDCVSDASVVGSSANADAAAVELLKESS
jgi:hypothetical protein